VPAYPCGGDAERLRGDPKSFLNVICPLSSFAQAGWIRASIVCQYRQLNRRNNEIGRPIMSGLLKGLRPYRCVQKAIHVIICRVVIVISFASPVGVVPSRSSRPSCLAL
jgi:hypothetical protein